MATVFDGFDLSTSTAGGVDELLILLVGGVGCFLAEDYGYPGL